MDWPTPSFVKERGEDKKLHLCAFFSRRLTPAEKNYHVGDRELLAVKLALEEYGIGLREPNTHSKYSSTTIIWSTFNKPNNSILSRRAGLCSSTGSNSCCRIVLAPRILNLMPCLEFMVVAMMEAQSRQSSQAPSLWLLYGGNWKQWGYFILYLYLVGLGTPVHGLHHGASAFP
ncbi:hypothetical protein QTP86_031063, partial [Hemibagrus guttatus]